MHNKRCWKKTEKDLKKLAKLHSNTYKQAHLSVSLSTVHGTSRALRIYRRGRNILKNTVYVTSKVCMQIEPKWGCLLMLRKSNSMYEHIENAPSDQYQIKDNEYIHTNIQYMNTKLS